MTAVAPILNKVPVGPKGQFLLGNIPDIAKKGGILEYYFDLWQHYGDITRSKLGPLNNVTVARPEHVQHVLVKNPEIYIKGSSHAKLRFSIGNGILTLEGEKWFGQRKLMQPMYTPKGIRQFADIMIEEAQNLIKRWDAEPDISRPIDINQEMAQITMSVISRSMFGVDIGAEYKDAVKSLYILLTYTSSTTNRLIDIPLFIPTQQNKDFKWARATLGNFIDKIIAERRKNGLRDDLLSMLMSSKDADTGLMMSDEQIRNEVIITFFAGHETTASLLTWTFYLLAKHQEVEAKLHGEVDNVLNGRTPTLEDIPKFPYMKQIFDETLRLYSPVAMLARDAQADDSIDGYDVPKGTMVVVLPYATHRHPDYWEKPLDFYPEHFTAEQMEKRPRYAYYPFGAGQRVCLGVHFAQMEAALIMADLAQKYSLRLTNNHDGAVTFIGIIRPKSPIMMTRQPRTK